MLLSKRTTKRMSNSALQPTATIAAHSVLRPPCLLRMAAAERNVGQAWRGHYDSAECSSHGLRFTSVFGGTRKQLKLPGGACCVLSNAARYCVRTNTAAPSRRRPCDNALFRLLERSRWASPAVRRPNARRRRDVEPLGLQFGRPPPHAQRQSATRNPTFSANFTSLSVAGRIPHAHQGSLDGRIWRTPGRSETAGSRLLPSPSRSYTVERYITPSAKMIVSFADQGTEDVYNGVTSRRARTTCPMEVWPVARRKLDQLNAARALDDLRAPPANRLEALKGNRRGQHSIRVNDQYRICFTWSSAGPSGVEIVDYH
jgi:toxin HigB-1